MSFSVLRPVFSGKTLAGERVVVYQRFINDQPLDEFHIQIPNGELWALPSTAKVATVDNLEDHTIHISVKSSVWTGMAVGSRVELIEEPDRSA